MGELVGKANQQHMLQGGRNSYLFFWGRKHLIALDVNANEQIYKYKSVCKGKGGLGQVDGTTSAPREIRRRSLG